MHTTNRFDNDGNLRFLLGFVVRSLVFYVMFCRSLFVILSFFFWPLYCFSFDLWFLITPLVFQTFPDKFWSFMTHVQPPVQNCFVKYLNHINIKIHLIYSVQILHVTSSIGSHYRWHFTQPNWIRYRYNCFMKVYIRRQL